MNGLKPYDIPVKTAGLGAHKYEFKIDGDFFLNFEESPLKEGDFEVVVEMDKRPNIIELNFDINGSIKSPCDLCLAEIEVPVSDQKTILVKFSELEKADEEEVIYINSEDPYVNIGSLLYEFIVLAVPISKRIDCEANNYQHCDQKVLEYLDQEVEEEETGEERDIWGSLKDIKFN